MLGAACTKPPPPPAPKFVAVDATWKIIGHVMTAAATIDERDAVAWNGREIEITKAGYASPFQGTCDEAARQRRTRQLTDVVLEIDMPHSVVTDYDFGDKVTEYKLTCHEKLRPPLAIWIDGDRALTCFGGVCYLLRR